MLNFLQPIAAAVAVVTLAGCAGIQFATADRGDGMPYYTPAPILKVTQGTDCVLTAEVVTIPGEKRFLKFRPGLGTSKLSFKITNGMLTEVNSETSGAVADAVSLANSLEKMTFLSQSSARASGCSSTIRGFRIGYGAQGITVDQQPIFTYSSDLAKQAIVESSVFDNASIQLDEATSNQM